MSRIAEVSGQSETFVNDTVIEYAEDIARRAPRLEVALPEQLEMADIRQSLEHCSTFEQNGPRQSSSRLPGANIWHSRLPSDTGSFKTVTTHDSEGRVARVLRPTRLPQIPSGSSYYATTVSTPIGVSSSSPTGNQEPYQGPVISATSQDIQIGLNTRPSSFSASEIQDGADSFWDETASETFLTRTANRPAHQSRKLTGEKAASLHHMDETDPWGFPSPLPEAHLSRGSVFEPHQDRRSPRQQAVPSMSSEYTPPSWKSRFLHCSAYILAILSVLLPAAFLAVGIAIPFANGKPVSSRWAVVSDIVGVLTILWPIILAAVLVQSLLSWMTLKAGRPQVKYTLHGEAIKQSFDRSQIEAICLLLVMGWSIAPLGSLALQSVFSTNTATRQTQVDVWYVDRTGQNELWSANPTSALSTTSRLQLIQTVGERYARSLLVDANTPMFNDVTGNVTLGQTLLQSSNVPTDTQSMGISTPDTTSYLNATTAVTGTTASQITLDMTTSYLDFSCDDWALTIRDFEDFTIPSDMSYSISQTLGMRMSTGLSNTEFPAGNVTIASLNKITDNGSLALDEIWEYSIIQCSWTQLFYTIPVRCDWDEHIGLSNCGQYAADQLLLDPDAVLGTELGDFADDFVLSGNVPTTERISTATERYIQNGGPVQLDTLDLTSNGTELLNLSATVTPINFAQRFGHLFNTWVALGYCPQCSPEKIVGNGTDSLAGTQQQYRRANATLSSPEEPQLTVKWAWEAVILSLGLTLLIAGLTAIAFEYGKLATSYRLWRRQAKKLESDQDSMRMLLSPVYGTTHAADPVDRYLIDRYPMPRRPVDMKTAREFDPDSKSLKKRISMRLSRMSDMSFTMPIQGTRVQSVEEPAFERRSSREFFARRYSNIPDGRYPSPRRSLSEDPNHRKSTATMEYEDIPGPGYSFSNGPYLFPPQDGTIGQIRDESAGGETSRKENLLSGRYSHIFPGRCRAPQQQSPVDTERDGQLDSEGLSWIYDEFTPKS